MNHPTLTKDEAAREVARYATSVSVVRHDQPSLSVAVLRDSEVFGEYERDARDMFNTFQPFIGPDIRTYALFARKYSVTRVMSLPDCDEVGGDQANAYANFYPMSYYVPYDPARGLDGSSGFVGGRSLGLGRRQSVGLLDLRDVRSVVTNRSTSFVGMSVPIDMSLVDAIDLSDWDLTNRFSRLHEAAAFAVPYGHSESDPSVIVEDRGIDPTASIAEHALLRPFDSFFVSFLNERGHVIGSHASESFLPMLAHAVIWARERQRPMGIWGASYGRDWGETQLGWVDIDVAWRVAAGSIRADQPRSWR
jgi:hypothetical protein